MLALSKGSLKVKLCLPKPVVIGPTGSAIGKIGVQLSSENGLNFVITRPQNCVKTRPKDQHEKQIEW
jgi:hypothetical protein